MQTIVFSMLVAAAAVFCFRAGGSKKSETDRLYELLRRVESYGRGGDE